MPAFTPIPGYGTPVLRGVSGESAEIVERKSVGFVSEPENVETLCAELSCAGATAEGAVSIQMLAAARYDRTALALRMLAIIDATAAASVVTTAIRAADKPT
jgi:hypothetical protein